MSSCNCNKVQPASITPVIALGSVASPYFVQANITQRLCYKTCADVSPVFSPRFSVVSVASVGTSQYMITINVQGIISYVQCGGDCSCTRTQPVNQNFTVPIFKSGTAPVVTITQGSTINEVAVSGCQTCSRTFVSETPLTITVA